MRARLVNGIFPFRSAGRPAAVAVSVSTRGGVVCAVVDAVGDASLATAGRARYAGPAASSRFTASVFRNAAVATSSSSPRGVHIVSRRFPPPAAVIRRHSAVPCARSPGSLLSRARRTIIPSTHVYRTPRTTHVLSVIFF